MPEGPGVPWVTPNGDCAVGALHPPGCAAGEPCRGGDADSQSWFCFQDCAAKSPGKKKKMTSAGALGSKLISRWQVPRVNLEQPRKDEWGAVCASGRQASRQS